MKFCAFLKRLAPVGLLVIVSVLRAGDVALSDGQNAENIVGQTDGGGAGVYTQGGPFNSNPLDGLNYPYDVAIDTTNHRLFVADTSSHRILEYDLNSSNVLVDLSADRVLGQADFSSNLSGTSANQLKTPTGLCYWPSTNQLFVVEFENNRVMVFDVGVITNGENAVKVLGQSSFTAGASATTQSGLAAPYGVTLESSASLLYVADGYNNRVMVFNVAAITDGENAVNVLGQSNFTSNSANVTQNTMAIPRGVAHTQSGKLFVSDSFSNRVLVFDTTVITNGENAVNVLGQSNYTSGGSAVTQSGMTVPWGLDYDGTTSRLFVADSAAARVLVFDVGAITNGENAVNVLGQSSYTSSTLAISQGGMVYPSGVAMAPGEQILHVVDQYSNRVTMYDVTAITNGENAVNVAGQTNGAGSPVYTTANAYDGVPQEGIDNPYDVAVDTVSHRLFVADFYGNRVLVYNLDASNTIVDRTMDNVLGQSDLKSVRTDTTQNSMKYPSGLAFDATTNRLFVSNYGSNRVLVFDVAAITDGENAVNVLGQADFTSETPATTQSGMYTPAGLSFNSNLLYVADLTNTRVTVFDVTAITDGENAVNVLGAANFTAWAPAAAQNRTNFPLGVHHDGGTRLYVADSSNNRVLVFDTAVITDGENAVSVLGQATFTTNAAGITQSAMNVPFGLATDSSTNRLFVSDYLSARVLVFDVAVITNGENAVNVLGQADFTSSNPAVTQSGMFLPSGLEYEAGMNRLYMGDNYNNRVLVHSAGPVSPSTSTLVAVEGSVDGGVDLSWASAGDDWMYGNLTGDYRIQYATTAATAWSTGTTPSGAYTLTISTTNQTPGVSQSTSVVVGLIQTWYFVIWTKDEANNWSVISDTVSVVPFLTNRSVVITSGGGQDWGAVMMGSTVVGSTGTVFLNDGNVANTYSLTASTVTAGSPWSVQSSPPAGPNQLVIYGAFHGTAPVSGDYGVEDVVYGTGQSSTGTVFTVDGSSTGASVPFSENRTLWIRMDFPTTTTTVEQQTIKVQVTAQAP